MTPNTAAENTAAAEKRKVFHTACQVSRSANTCQDSPAEQAFTTTAASGNKQHMPNTAAANASSTYSPTDCGSDGITGETALSEPTRLPNHAYSNPAAVTPNTSHTSTEATAISSSNMTNW